MFMSATSLEGQQLQMTGLNIHRVAAGSAEEWEGHFYSFYFSESNRHFIAFSVSDALGNVLGTEKLRFSVVSRGYEYVGLEM
jgi:hypothetical protein